MGAAERSDAPAHLVGREVEYRRGPEVIRGLAVAANGTYVFVQAPGGEARAVPRAQVELVGDRLRQRVQLCLDLVAAVCDLLPVEDGVIHMSDGRTVDVRELVEAVMARITWY